jgi:hypothetical protein
MESDWWWCECHFQRPIFQKVGQKFWWRGSTEIASLAKPRTRQGSISWERCRRLDWSYPNHPYHEEWLHPCARVLLTKDVGRVERSVVGILVGKLGMKLGVRVNWHVIQTASLPRSYLCSTEVLSLRERGHVSVLKSVTLD